MAVYKMKRNKPVQESPEQKEAFAPEMAEEKELTATISRTKNRSLDAYVGSGTKARRSKENGGSMVDAVYNKRETAGQNVSNDTDRLLMEAFADEKQAKKERKRLAKEEAARKKLEEKERKKQEKLLRKGLVSPEDAEDDGYSPLESIYPREELDSARKKSDTPSVEEEKGSEGSVFDSGFFESLLAGSGASAAKPAEEKLAPEASEEKKAPEVSLTTEAIPFAPAPLAKEEAPSAEASPAPQGEEAVFDVEKFFRENFASQEAAPAAEEAAQAPASQEAAPAAEEAAQAPSAQEAAPAAEEAAQAPSAQEAAPAAEEAAQAPSAQEAAPAAEEAAQAPSAQEAAPAAEEAAQAPSAQEAAPAAEEAAQAPSAQEAPAAEAEGESAPGEKTGEEIYREIYGEDPAAAAQRTREFDLTGVDPETVRKILEKEAIMGYELGKDSDKPISLEDLYGDAPLEKALTLKDSRKQEQEFTQSDTAEEMTENIKDKSASVLVGALWTGLLTLISAYLAAICFTDVPHPDFLAPGKFGLVLLLVDLQLLIVCGVLVWKHLLGGFAALFQGKATADSVTAVGMTVVLIHQVTLLLTSFQSEKLMMFGAVGCFLAFLSSIQHFLDERRNYRAFRVVSSPKEKFVAKRLGRNSSEYEALKEHLPDDPDMFTIEKTKFVKNYFARSRDNGQVCAAYNAAVWMVLVAALAFGIYNFSGGVLQGITAFTIVTLMGLPACALFAVSLPLSRLSRKCAATDSAVIGMAAMEEYSTASVLSFRDTELFPAKRIRISSFRAYGNYPIDRSILYAAMIFKKVGGPLSGVFSSALGPSYGSLDRKFDILENTGDGICAKIDGREVFVGNKDYMLSYDFGYVNDDVDESFENSVGRIMYMAVGNGIAAKFYMKYAVNRKFERVMRRLQKSGICISVKTCDPNLDNELIKCIMKNREYPVCVLKTAGASKENAVREEADSGIVCTSSILNMLRAFLNCEKAKRSVGTNLLVKFISLMVGLFVSVLLCFMGRMDSVTTFFILGYQLLWLVAVVLPSLTD